MQPILRRIFEVVKIDAEVLVVYDDPSDTTVPAIQNLQSEFSALRAIHNTYGRGPANAIKFGIDSSKSQDALTAISNALVG